MRARANPPQPNAVVAYIRVSSEKQVDEGVSLEAQEAKLRAYAALYELTIVEVVVDAGASAKTLERPGLQRALGLLKNRAATGLLVTKLDRLTRSVRDLGTLISDHFEAGCALLSVSEQIDTRTAGGRLVLNILASVAQWEREAIGERTSQAMQHLRESGRYTGGRTRWGYTIDDDGRLQPVEGEQHAAVRARELRANGMTFQAISDTLSAAGILSRAGRPFAPSQVRRMTTAC